MKMFKNWIWKKKSTCRILLLSYYPLDDESHLRPRRVARDAEFEEPDDDEEAAEDDDENLDDDLNVDVMVLSSLLSLFGEDDFGGDALIVIIMGFSIYYKMRFYLC